MGCRAAVTPQAHGHSLLLPRASSESLREILANTFLFGNGSWCPFVVLRDLTAKNANGPGISEAVCENTVPRQGTTSLLKQSGLKSSYFKEGRTLPCESTVPERHPRGGMDPEGFEPSPMPWQGIVLPFTPRAHRESLYRHIMCFAKICRNLSRMSFILGRPRWCACESRFLACASRILGMTSLLSVKNELRRWRRLHCYCEQMSR